MSRAQAVERAFQTAFRHMCEAATFDDAADQLSNALHQLYRLSELGQAYGGPTGFYQRLTNVSGGDVAAAVLWVRTFDTHGAVEVGKPADVLSDYVTNLLGVLVWKHRAQLPPPDPKYPAHGRDLLYDKRLAGKPVLDTTQVALRALLQLV
jgi:hypothetical protein